MNSIMKWVALVGFIAGLMVGVVVSLVVDDAYRDMLEKQRAAREMRSLGRGSIREMAVGDAGWTPSWAVWTSRDGRHWLRPGYHVLIERTGTADLLVTRTAAGFVVVTTSCQDCNEYRIVRGLGMGYDDSPPEPGSIEFLPIVEVI